MPDRVLERVHDRQHGNAHRVARVRVGLRRLERRRLFGNRGLPSDDERGHGCDRTTFTSTQQSAETPGSPTPVLTGAPAAVTDGGAGFSGSVNPDGLPTTAYFQYGLDKKYSQVGASGPNYTAQTSGGPGRLGLREPRGRALTVTGLVPNALYHVRLVATNSAGTTFGQDVTFTTAMAPAPGAPTLGQTFNIEPISGLVLSSSTDTSCP